MLDPDPVAQFARWLADAEAAGLPEPNAMVLATVSAAGQPRGRTVLLKSHDAGGFVFYTNRTSRKGTDLAAVAAGLPDCSPGTRCSRQVIIEGAVQELSTPDSEPYFRSRPRGSQLGAWASRQSTVIGSRDELEKRYAELEQRWAEGRRCRCRISGAVTGSCRPSIEFWQGRVNRLHDRFRYRRGGDAWVIERLAP